MDSCENWFTTARGLLCAKCDIIVMSSFLPLRPLLPSTGNATKLFGQCLGLEDMLYTA